VYVSVAPVLPNQYHLTFFQIWRSFQNDTIIGTHTHSLSDTCIHTHTLSLSLSLSLTHTHTHSHTYYVQVQTWMKRQHMKWQFGQYTSKMSIEIEQLWMGLVVNLEYGDLESISRERDHRIPYNHAPNSTIPHTPPHTQSTQSPQPLPTSHPTSNEIRELRD